MIECIMTNLQVSLFYNLYSFNLGQLIVYPHLFYAVI